MGFGSQTIDEDGHGLLILPSSTVLLTAVLDPDIIIAIERLGGRVLALVRVVGEEGGPRFGGGRNNGLVEELQLPLVSDKESSSK